VGTSSKWHARHAAIEFVQSMIFCNMFTARPFAPRIRELVLKYLFDEQVEVRAVASVTLAGFYQCGFIQVAKKDLVKIDHLHFLDKHCLIYRNIFA
jgi:hypothetical protein